MARIEPPKTIKDDPDQTFIPGCEPVKRKRTRRVGLLGDDEWNCLREWVGVNIREILFQRMGPSEVRDLATRYVDEDGTYEAAEGKVEGVAQRHPDRALQMVVELGHRDREWLGSEWAHVMLEAGPND